MEIELILEVTSATRRNGSPKYYELYTVFEKNYLNAETPNEQLAVEEFMSLMKLNTSELTSFCDPI